MIEVDLDWNGTATIRRTYSLETVGQGVVSLRNVAIDVLLPTRNISGIRVFDEHDGIPTFEARSLHGGTQITVWPGYPNIENYTYRMNLEYTHRDFGTRFENEGFIFGVEQIEPGRVAGTGIRPRLEYVYRIRLPQRQFFYFLPKKWNAVRLHHNAVVAFKKDRRDHLEWRWTAESGDPVEVLKWHFGEYPNENLHRLLWNVAVAILSAAASGIVMALRPSFVTFAREHLLNWLIAATH